MEFLRALSGKGLCGDSRHRPSSREAVTQPSIPQPLTLATPIPANLGQYIQSWQVFLLQFSATFVTSRFTEN